MTAVYHEAFPDLGVDTEEVIAAGEKVVVRVRLTGTHEGAEFDVDGRLARTADPSGREIDVVGVGIFHVEDGVITEVQWFVDKLQLLNQLDILPD